jgi:hypothetical protein
LASTTALPVVWRAALTAWKTELTESACMQRLLRQGDARLLYAFTQGLQLKLAHNAL